MGEPTHIDSLVELDRTCWHACTPGVYCSFVRWMNWAEFSFAPVPITEADKDRVCEAIAMLEHCVPSGPARDVLAIYAGMLEVRLAA